MWGTYLCQPNNKEKLRWSLTCSNKRNFPRWGTSPVILLLWQVVHRCARRSCAQWWIFSVNSLSFILMDEAEHAGQSIFRAVYRYSVNRHLVILMDMLCRSRPPSSRATPNDSSLTGPTTPPRAGGKEPIILFIYFFCDHIFNSIKYGSWSLVWAVMFMGSDVLCSWGVISAQWALRCASTLQTQLVSKSGTWDAGTS